MRINVRKLLMGGLVAGVVLVICNVLAQFVLVDRVRGEMNAWVPGLADRLSMGGGVVVAGIVLKLIIGILLVWLSAVLRPRFGSSARTASYGAVFVWILGGIFFSDYVMMGMMSGLTYAMVEILQLLSLLIAGWVGARIYFR